MANITITVNRNYYDLRAMVLAESITSSTRSNTLASTGTAFSITNIPISCSIFSDTSFINITTKDKRKAYFKSNESTSVINLAARTKNTAGLKPVFNCRVTRS